MIAKIREDLSMKHNMVEYGCFLVDSYFMIGRAGEETKVEECCGLSYNYRDLKSGYFWHKSWFEWVLDDNGILVYKNPEFDNDNEAIEFLEKGVEL